MGKEEEAFNTFLKLKRNLPNTAEVLCQLALMSPPPSSTRFADAAGMTRPTASPRP